MSRTNAGNLPTSRHTAAASHSSDSSSSRTASPRRAYAATLRALGDTKANSTVAHFCCPFVATVVTGTVILLHFFRTPADTFSTDQPPYAHHGKIEALLQMLWLTGNSTLDPCKDFYRHVVPNQFSYRLRAVEFSMCDISARMHCLAERRSKIGQTVTGKYANAMRVSNSIAAATARPTFLPFISFETRAPNLRQTVPKGDAASVRVIRSTPGKQRRNARVAVALVSTVRDFGVRRELRSALWSVDGAHTSH
ncbi:hypothetical protein HPB50_025971 [Hyalomma asiaticum]|uniref:Uncharacterized protein n=1 Tax=Hyalomma asiaticum TaxID=266040 RepID=A0ACB7SZQ2_HYAAI|nr:hypothetical protein HPB50_025971 [Hyalomma asiaticum]